MHNLNFTLTQWHILQYICFECMSFLTNHRRYNMNFTVIVHDGSDTCMGAFGWMSSELFLMSTSRLINAERLAFNVRQNCHIQLSNKLKIIKFSMGGFLWNESRFHSFYLVILSRLWKKWNVDNLYFPRFKILLRIKQAIIVYVGVFWHVFSWL